MGVLNRMAKRIALFNHKGGVSKTTTAFNLGWMLASRGKTVILVDADPQCNLTGMVLGYGGRTELDQFYENEPGRNIKAGLAPSFESRPSPIVPVECIAVQGRKNLYLLPGHIGLSEYEVTLGIAQELSGTIQTLQNLPGSLSHLLEITAAHHKADYVLIDMNPLLFSGYIHLTLRVDVNERFGGARFREIRVTALDVQKCVACRPKIHAVYKSRFKMTDQKFVSPLFEIVSIAGPFTLSVHPGHAVDRGKREHHRRNDVTTP